MNKKKQLEKIVNLWCYVNDTIMVQYFIFWPYTKGDYKMGWNDNHYRKEKNGDYYDQDEIEKAYGDGNLEKLSNGRYWDKETKEEYWKDGTKKS